MRGPLRVGLGVTAAGAAALAWGLYLAFGGGGATDVGPSALAPASAATPDAGSATPTATPGVPAGIHVVVSGERMVDIAERLCGDWSVWREFNRVERRPDGSLVEWPVTEDIAVGEWLRPPPGCQAPADEAPEPAPAEQANPADGAASAPAPAAEEAQPDARPTQRVGNPRDEPPWVVGRDILLGIAASGVGPPLGVALGISMMVFMFARSRRVEIRFRWDEAAAARRRRAAERDRGRLGATEAYPTEDTTPDRPPDGTTATPTIDRVPPDDAHRPGSGPAGGAALPGRDATIKPGTPGPHAARPLPEEPQPPSPAVGPQPAEPLADESTPEDSQPPEPHPTASPPVEPDVSEPRAAESQLIEPEPAAPQPAQSQPIDPESAGPEPLGPAQEVADAREPEPIPDYARDPFLGDPIFGIPARRRRPPIERTDE